MVWYEWFREGLSQLEILTGEFADFRDSADLYNGILACLCVMCGGLAAGLTIGLVPLDETKLEMKIIIGTQEEKEAARKILPIVRQHHLLMVTLLLFNALSNEMLPIFLGALVPNYLAIIISVTLVLLFGEIIPSAIFTGPGQLMKCARLIKLVKFLFFIFYPIALPLSLALDYMFGVEENEGFSRDELGAIVMMQGIEHRKSFRGDPYGNSPVTPINIPVFTPSVSYQSYDSINPPDESQNLIGKPTDVSENRNFFLSFFQSLFKKPSKGLELKAVSPMKEIEENQNFLTPNEVNIMTGVLKMAKFLIVDVMIPIEKVFMISSDTILNEKSLSDILASGFSRIPVYFENNKSFIIGYLLVKQLIVVNPLANVKLNNFPLRSPIYVKPTTRLLDLMSMFQEAQCHFAMVTRDPLSTSECIENKILPIGNARIIGIVTLEDVLEKIIQSDIMDETDLNKINSINRSFSVLNTSPNKILHAASDEAISTSIMAKHFLRPSRKSIGGVSPINTTSHSESSSNLLNTTTLKKRQSPRVFSSGSVVSAECFGNEQEFMIGSYGVAPLSALPSPDYSNINKFKYGISQLNQSENQQQ